MRALLTLSLLAFVTAVAAETPPAPEEASIPFATSNGIQDYLAVDSNGLYIRDIKGQWYYARTMGKCARLLSANTIGFEVSASDRLDRFGALRAQGWRCQLESLTKSEAPPRKQRG